MTHINGRPELAAGYFHESGDTQKTATALRATYSPSLSNRLTNRFGRQDLPKLAKFVNGVRNLDLSLRRAVNGRRLENARARVDAVKGRDDAGTEALQSAAERVRRLEHKDRRLRGKIFLGASARTGQLDEGVSLADQNLQTKLHQRGYVPLAGLGDVPHERIEAVYLVSPQDGHRIKINSERPPLLARMVADSVSAGYDRGSGGTGRAIRSTMQHALVGVYSAEQAVKGAGARFLAGGDRLDEGARARMQLRAERTAQNRRMVNAAFGGNVALNEAYRGVFDEQLGQSFRRDKAAPDPDALQAAVHGVKPLQTRYWERRVDAFYRQRAGDGTAPAASPGRIARFALGVVNLRAKASGAAYAALQRGAEAKAQASDGAVRANYLEQASHYGEAALKREQQVARRRSALQGRLLETLRETDTNTAPPFADAAARVRYE